MAHSIIVNSESFASSIGSFENKVKKVEDILKNISNYMKEIDGQNDTWKSKVGVRVHEEYKMIEDQFESINTELKNYETFLKQTLEDYKKEEEKQEKSINDNSDDLNVNE